MILITSIGEFLLYYYQFFFYFHFIVKKKKKKKTDAGLFLGCPTFAAGIHFQWIEILKAGYSLYFIYVNEGLQETSMLVVATSREKSKLM